LYIKDGATTGLAAINEYDFEFSMLSSLALLKPDRQKILPEFITVFLNHPASKQVIIANMAGAAITRLTLAKIKSVIIPVPPIEVQQKFADLYLKVREATRKISSGVDASDEAFEAISQKAFSGQL
jgi:type I restriction enzyme S subunit